MGNRPAGRAALTGAIHHLCRVRLLQITTATRRRYYASRPPRVTTTTTSTHHHEQCPLRQITTSTSHQHHECPPPRSTATAKSNRCEMRPVLVAAGASYYWRDSPLVRDISAHVSRETARIERPRPASAESTEARLPSRVRDTKHDIVGSSQRTHAGHCWCTSASNPSRGVIAAAPAPIRPNGVIGDASRSFECFT